MSALFCVFIAVLLVCVKGNDDWKIGNIGIEEVQEDFMWKILRLHSIFDEEKGVAKYGDDILSFVCIIPYNFTTVFKPFQSTISPRWVTIEECVLPTDTPLAEILQSLNVNVNTIEFLRLSMYYNRVPMPKGNYTIGLNLKGLWFSSAYLRDANILENNPDFMTPLTNLTTMIVWGTEIPIMPDSVHLKVLSLRHYAIVKTWLPFCKHLRELSIYNLIKRDMPDEWPDQCSQLTTLRLTQKESFGVNQLIDSGVDNSCKNLHTLSMPFCRYKEPPYKILNAAKDLVELNMSDNKIDDQSLANFPLMRNLTHLDMSRNQLKGWALFDLVKQLPSLQYLILNDNQFVNLFCNFETQLSDFASHLPSLESLSLRNMPMDVNCLESVHFSKLKYLDLASKAKIPIFDFKKLPTTNATELKVDLRGRPIQYMKFDKTDYKLLRNGNFSAFWGTKEGYNATNVTVWMSSVNCDCVNYWLARTLREMPHLLSSPGLQCQKTGREILNEPSENMNCDIYKRQRGCDVRLGEVEGEDRSIARVDCHTGTTSHEMYPVHDNDVIRTISLNVSNDNVRSLKYIPISDWLQWIDLRHNEIFRLDANDTSRLFASPERRVWLSGNPLICDCANKPLLDALHGHRQQVVDFNSIRCMDKDQPLSFVTSYKACHIGSYIALALLLLLLVTALLLWFYRRQVKMFLYSRNLLSLSNRRDDDEPDKEYDAFLLIAKEDEAYVHDQFLPKLEGKPNSYRVCVNYRNWTPGEYVPAAMERSVNISKRTILLLSRNLLRAMESPEFRLWVIKALKQNPERLLVVVLDDVSSEPMYADLKVHLPRTQFKCSDSHFWGKLRYAMPHTRVSDSNMVNVDSTNDNAMVTKI